MHGFSIIFSSPHPSHPIEMYTNAGLNPPALPSSFLRATRCSYSAIPAFIAARIGAPLILSTRLHPAKISRGFFEGRFPSIRLGNDRGKTSIRDGTSPLAEESLEFQKGGILHLIGTFSILHVFFADFFPI